MPLPEVAALHAASPVDAGPAGSGHGQTISTAAQSESGWPILGALYTQAKHSLQQEGQCRLPPVPGLAPALLVRWLYQRWLEDEGRWAPLLLVSPRHLEPIMDRTPAWWSAARGGWLWLGPEPFTVLPRSLLAEVQARRVSLLVQGEGPPVTLPVTLPESLIAALQRYDSVSAMATDPGLEPLRQSLLVHCRAAGAVTLTGEAGTETSLLARWAHTVLDRRPLSLIHGDTGRPQPGEWCLFEDVSSLSPARKSMLEQRIQAQLVPPPRRLPPPRRARPSHPAFQAILGESAALVSVLEQALVLAPSRMPVLITGETGVGKEALARAVHVLSGRRGPFVALDVGALPETLAESILFGHRKGAFTGAERHRPGAFRSAEGGTLFLDELGNLPPLLQSRLLRVLQEGEVLPLGEDLPVRVDVRVVAATNAELSGMVQRGTFRADLLARLNAAVLELPPLRDRIDDLEVLARHFIGLERAIPVEGPWCTDEARQVLSGYHWPGNVRELSNILRYAAAVGPAEGLLGAEHLGPLAPGLRRKTPILCTTSRSRWEDPSGQELGLDRAAALAITSTTLHLPPVRERPVSARLHALLQLLGGRPVHEEALRLLLDHPWWGNDHELRATGDALQQLPAGGIDVARLRRCLPHLLQPSGFAPIRVLLSPTRLAGGRVGGLMQDFFGKALLVGRIRSRGELELAGRAGDARAQATLLALEALCGETPPDCLELGLLSRLSRAHLLITREGQGLRVHLLPAASLGAQACSLEPPGRGLEPVRPGHSVRVGGAGEVHVLEESGRIYLRLFLFAGRVAFDEHAEAALARTESPGQAPPTLVQPGAPWTPTPEQLGPGLRVWTVNTAEAAALTELLASFRGGQLKAHITRGLQALSGAPYQRLVDYLERAPRLSQYLVRLYEVPENACIRQALRLRLAVEPDREVRLLLLPEGLRRCLEQE